ncbi:uncharacterized protein LOC131019435 isoform X4 [Salvia miltiorrhiza]|uniref:uncharacterized protein LOC131019435 isoform X4 n=1 Tax=Salvia miltiorrhiza TaxID=226208 RepID=UPI0025AC5A04|nr:uncharacterized protein LOC131019435 isoform X4 [Salvia miltiorrhiza]
MATAKGSSIVLPRTRKQRKRVKRKVKIREKWKAMKTKKLKEKANVTPLVTKYWLQRYDLFSKYDAGIKMDEEGWFSVTPEEIAARQARRFAGAGVVIDAFAGVGGNAIQFAKVCHHVVAIEIDPKKVALAFHNAKIYGVQDQIDFIVGDFFQLAPFLKSSHSLFQAAQAITPNIVMFLPRNVDVLQASELSWLSSPPLDIEMEENLVRGRLKGITVYFRDTMLCA